MNLGSTLFLPTATAGQTLPPSLSSFISLLIVFLSISIYLTVSCPDHSFTLKCLSKSTGPTFPRFSLTLPDSLSLRFSSGLS